MIVVVGQVFNLSGQDGILSYVASGHRSDWVAGAGLSEAKEAPVDLALPTTGASLPLVVPAPATPIRQIQAELCVNDRIFEGSYARMSCRVKEEQVIRSERCHPSGRFAVNRRREYNRNVETSRQVRVQA